MSSTQGMEGRSKLIRPGQEHNTLSVRHHHPRREQGQCWGSGVHGCVTITSPGLLMAAPRAGI